MATKRSVTSDFRLHSVEQFIESIDEVANSTYYVFAGRHTDFPTSNVPQPTDSVRDRHYRAYATMVFGKQVTPADIYPMARRIDYEANVVYTAYDDQDALLEQRDYYVVVDAGAQHHVWKCLDNGSGSLSTVEPDFSEIDGNDEVYQTSDGYRWKYMYSVSDTVFDRFATTNFIPVVANAEVAAAAVDGAIDTIRVESAGEGYDCYVSGVFSSSDIRLGGNNLAYAIPPSSASVNGYYDGCVLYLTAGTGAGQYRTVTRSYVNSSTKWVVLETPFDVVPTNGTEFDLTPRVEIVGDGRQTINAAARAIVNSVGNTIHRVEMLSRGAGYQSATASVVAPAALELVAPASLRVVYSPPGGHGSNAAAELMARSIGISVTFANSESGTIPTSNDFRKIGLLKDPKFANVSLSVTVSSGDFFPTETAWVSREARLGGVGTTVSGNTEFVVDVPGLDNLLVPGSFVRLSDGPDSQLVKTVSASSNDTHTSVAAQTAIRFTSSNVVVGFVTPGASGVVTSVSVGGVVLDSVSGTVAVGDVLVGEESGAVATVDSIERSGIEKTFATFVQAHVLVGTPVSGSFVEDELVYQGDASIANAILHSVTTTNGVSRYLLTEMNGTFNVGGTIVGQTSGAQAEVTAKYSPELEYGSGTVLYVENSDAIERAPDQSETFKLVISY